MSKLSDELIGKWIEGGEHFELRSDGGGLCVAYPARYKSPMWVFRYRQNGEQHRLSLGRYPDVSIDEARQLAASYRKLIEDGESVVAEVGNKRRGDSDKELARTFSALLREASRHGAKRMTVTIEFEGGESWAN